MFLQKDVFLVQYFWSIFSHNSEIEKMKQLGICIPVEDDDCGNDVVDDGEHCEGHEDEPDEEEHLQR